MIKGIDFITYFPYEFRPKNKVTVNGTDVTKYIRVGEFTRVIFFLGIGYFRMVLMNSKGTISNNFNRGDEVVFYGDTTGSAATTVKFKGRIDRIKEDISSTGQYLEIEGRHKAYISTETYVSYSAENTDGSIIIKALIDEHLNGYTYNNVVSSIGKSITVNWDKKPILECFKDLCLLCEADGYVDDDLDFHFFKENSIFNEDEAAIEGVTLIELRGFGKDDFLKRDKITVKGQDSKGLPILYTSGTGDRQKPIVDTSINTMAETENRATREYDSVKEDNLPPQGTAYTKGMGCPTNSLQVGDNIQIWSGRQKVEGVYKVIKITDRIGTQIGVWTSELNLEKEERDIEKLISDSKRKEIALTTSDNPFNMEHSYNFEFDDTTNIDTTLSEGIEVNNGFLRATGTLPGKMVSKAKVLPVLVKSFHIKEIGENIDADYRVSNDNGVTFNSITKDTLLTLGVGGDKIVLEVKINSLTSGIDSISLMAK